MLLFLKFERCYLNFIFMMFTVNSKILATVSKTIALLLFYNSFIVVKVTAI